MSFCKEIYMHLESNNRHITKFKKNSEWGDHGWFYNFSITDIYTICIQYHNVIWKWFHSCAGFKFSFLRENLAFLRLAWTHPKLELAKRELGSWKRGQWMWWEWQKLGFGVLCRAALGKVGGREKGADSEFSVGKWGDFLSGRMGRSACLARGRCPLTWGYHECGKNPTALHPEEWGQEVKEAAHEGTRLLHSHWVPLKWLSPREMWVDFLTIQAPLAWTRMTPTVETSWTGQGQPPVVLLTPKPLTPRSAQFVTGCEPGGR